MNSEIKKLIKTGFAVFFSLSTAIFMITVLPLFAQLSAGNASASGPLVQIITNEIVVDFEWYIALNVIAAFLVAFGFPALARLIRSES